MELSYEASIVVGILATIVIAYVVGRLVMQRMVGASAEAGVLATLGIALILQNTVILVFGGGYKFFSGGYIEPVSVWVSPWLSNASSSSFVRLRHRPELMVTLQSYGKVHAGRLAEHRMLRGVGIDVPQVVLRTFILGAALAALSGVLTAPVNVNVYGGMGELITFKTLPIIIMGGLGNVRGTFLRRAPRHRRESGRDICGSAVP